MATAPEGYVGWEPQWILIKNISNSEGWRLFDSMRGMTHNDVDARLFPASADAESVRILVFGSEFGKGMSYVSAASTAATDSRGDKKKNLSDHQK